MVPGRIQLQATWATRYQRVAAPSFAIGDLTELQGLGVGEVLPYAYQTDFPPEFAEILPGECGRYPLGPFLPRYERAFAAGLGVDDIPELDWTPPAKEAAPVLTIANRARHTNFRQDIANGVDTPILPSDPFRTYLLIVNEGATDCFVGFDKSSNDGIPLANGGGFIELTLGTTSAVRAQGDGGATVIKVLEGRTYPARVCVLPCETVN